MIDEQQFQKHEAISAVNQPDIIEPNIIQPKSIYVRRPNAVFMAVGSLKRLQTETRAIEVEFFERVYELETEFQKKHESVYQKRCEIINGGYVPTEADGQSPDQKETKSQSNLPEPSGCKTHVQSGLPNFWCNVLASALPDVHENDRPILKHLTDVRGKNKPLTDLGFILEFHFSPNEFFENSVLRKEYFYTSSDNKMIHEIPLIRKSLGCEIEWKEGKAPTYPSWFDFLASSKIISDSDEEFMAYISGIQKDFEMGYFIKEHVIPKAVLYFTGEEKNLFTICHYNSGFWSPLSSNSSENLTEDGIPSEDESENESEAGCKSELENNTENDAQEQGKASSESE